MYTNTGYLDIADADLEDDTIPLRINCCGVYRLLTRLSLTTIRATGRPDYQLLYIASGKAEFVLNGAAVTIPAGIDDGQAVSLRGQGNAGKNGGPAGDLIVGVRIKPHPHFQREGTTVLYEHPVSFYQATVGAELEIPTIDGKVKYNIPEGTQPSTVFRLRNKGIPYVNGRGRGDQYVRVNLEVPTNLSSKQKEALNDFDSLTGDKNYHKRIGFFDKLKDFMKD